tara:strand:+ start:39 stop:206 length:168 start_codon:yes stop_codon:yes gene_type:complete
MKTSTFSQVDIGKVFIYEQVCLIKQDIQDEANANAKDIKNGETWFFEEQDEILVI